MFDDKLTNLKFNVVESFGRVRKDVAEFKRSVTDWILYLDSNQRDMNHRVRELEAQIAEMKKERMLYN